MMIVNPFWGGGNGGSGGTSIDACCYVDASSGTPIIQKASNVSSITDSGVGDYVINFTTALASANFSWAGSATKPNGTSQALIAYGRGDIARNVNGIAVRVSSDSGVATDTTFSVIVTGA